MQPDIDNKTQATLLKTILALDTDPVGIFLLDAKTDRDAFSQWERLEGHRYCQALMKARRGKSVTLDKSGLVCPAAAAAFGFRSLPAGLKSGKGLMGFGIVESGETGKVMFEGMRRLEPGRIAQIALSPLSQAPWLPDVVVVEGRPESLMWLLLADVNLAGGLRCEGNTAVLQATCVDATIIPYKEKVLNFSFGCYGCREATDLSPEETVVGFPGEMLDGLVKCLQRLATKAIPRSREKRAYVALMGKDEGHAQPLRPAGGAMWRPALPRLNEDIMISLTPEDVISVTRIALDQDRDASLAFVTDRLEREIRKVTDKVH
jgi:uncharacterized protein (DUF169 family)